MKRCGYVAVMLLAATMNVSASESWSGRYQCLGDAAGGVVYDADAGKWVGAALKTDDRFIIDAKFVGAEPSLESEQFSVSVTVAGSEEEMCFADGNRAIVVIGTANATGNCWITKGRYTFNFTTLRYLRYYPYGYTGGPEQSGNTPSVTVGTCTRM